MSDIPVRPPAPAPALPAGWTEHKAPSGSYGQLRLASYAPANIPQVTHTTTMPRRESQHIRDQLQKSHNTTTPRRLLHLLPTTRRKVTISATTANQRKSPFSLNPQSTTSSSRVRRNNSQSMAARINNHEVGIGEECAAGITTSTTEEENGTIGQSIAKTSRTARPGCW